MCVSITNDEIREAKEFADPKDISRDIEDKMLDRTLGLGLTQEDPILHSAPDPVLDLTPDPILDSVIGSVLKAIPSSVQHPIPDSLLEWIVDSVPWLDQWSTEGTTLAMT